MAQGFGAWRWTLTLTMYFLSLLERTRSYKKPAFCDQDGDPFSFLWKINRDPPSYLFGTIHVPYTKVWDHIPDNAKQAFSASSHVYFELDLVNPTTVSALSTCQMLPPGKNLSDVLPEDLYSRLKKHLEYVRGMMPHWMTADQRGRGLYADYLFNAIAGNWERKRPVWVMLMVNSLTESDVQSRGVPVLDLYLAQEAERLRKKTAAVEKVEEQCLPLNGLNFSQVLFALNHTLIQHEELRENEIQSSYTTDDLIRHYNCGDLNAVVFSQDTAPVPTISNWTLSDEDALLAKNIDMYFRQELIYNRNMRMGNRVAELLENNPGQTLFFAFGAGHFLGNNTVLDFVESHGYDIEHLSVSTKIPKSKSKKSVRFLSGNGTGQKSPGTSKSTMPPRKGVSRRTNRRRSPVSSPFQNAGSPLNLRHIYYSSTTEKPPVTSQRNRRFNDLWVRLDSYGKLKQSIVHDKVVSNQVPKHAQHPWLQKSHGQELSVSGSARTAVPAVTSILLTLLFHVNAFAKQILPVDLTGVT